MSTCTQIPLIFTVFDVPIAFYEGGGIAEEG